MNSEALAEFEQYLATIPLDRYREELLPVKTVEQDLPSDLNPLPAIYDALIGHWRYLTPLPLWKNCETVLTGRGKEVKERNASLLLLAERWQRWLPNGS